MVAKVAPGDVVSVNTRSGLALLQYVRYVRPYGALVRVLSGTYQSLPADLQALVNGRELFWGFVPLAPMIDRALVHLVGHYQVPEHARSMPLMRAPAGGLRSRRWWLWDGEKEWLVDRSDPLVRDASMKAAYNDTALIEAIEAGRTPRQEFERWQD